MNLKTGPVPTCEVSTVANMLASQHYHTLSKHVAPVNN